MDYILIVSGLAITYFVIQFLLWSRKEKKREEKKDEERKKKVNYNSYQWDYKYNSSYNSEKNIDFHKICKLIENDFLSSNKRMSKLEIHDIYYQYNFDNYEEVKVFKDHVYYSNQRINISDLEYLTFLKLYNILIKHANFDSKFHNYQKKEKIYTKEEIYTKDQLEQQKKFYKLKEISDLRFQQLEKISKTDPNRANLVNELNIVRNKMKIIFSKTGLKMIKTKN
jgi:hypothetical protein